MFVFLNNQMLPAAEARVSVFDRGFAYGDSLFETMKTIGGRPVFFAEHIARLRAGMETAGFGGLPATEALREQALELAGRNGVEIGRLRLMVTRGTPDTPDGPDPGEGLTPTVLLSLEAFAGMPPELYEKGVRVQTLHTNRGRYAGLKSAGLLGSILARKEIHHAGAWEAVLTSGHGHMLEGVYSNIFFLAGKLLLTAPLSSHILPGIVRQKVVDIAPEVGLEVECVALTMEELQVASAAAFLTSSMLGICRVSEIDGQPLPADPGAIALLQERLAVQESISSREQG